MFQTVNYAGSFQYIHIHNNISLTRPTSNRSLSLQKRERNTARIIRFFKGRKDYVRPSRHIIIEDRSTTPGDEIHAVSLFV